MKVTSSSEKVVLAILMASVALRARVSVPGAPGWTMGADCAFARLELSAIKSALAETVAREWRIDFEEKLKRGTF